MFNYRLIVLILIMSLSFFGNSKAEYKNIFYDFKINSINDEVIDLSIYKNKTVLLVNVASKCGFTKQYEDLQNLYNNYKDKGLIVIGVPSNQFGSQERGTKEEL